jgi:hypothetical protein
MHEHEDGRVSGSIDRARVAELYAATDDDELKAHYREVLGESDEGKALDEESEDYETVEAGEALPALEDLRAQAEELGIEVDGRWREQRLLDEIAAAKAEDEA